MTERWVDLETEDGTINTFVVDPDAASPVPVVLFYMDAYGQREELYDMARRIGGEGYYVVLPNLYYRSTREFVGNDDDPASIERMGKMMFAIGNRMIARDTEALLAMIDADEAADSERIGCVGYCMSGPFAITVAAVHADRIACAASVYGAALVTQRPDSPHLVLEQVKGELCFMCAGIDEWVPRETIEQLGAYLDSAGAHYSIEWYDDAHHGFAFPSREGQYDERAAEHHWQQLFALFDRNLRKAE
jgi:carboxymethylenebutenolidase